MQPGIEIGVGTLVRLDESWTELVGSLGNKQMEDTMAWKTPKIVEIALGAEINSYACAGLK